MLTAEFTLDFSGLTRERELFSEPAFYQGMQIFDTFPMELQHWASIKYRPLCVAAFTRPAGSFPTELQSKINKFEDICRL